MKKCSGTYVTMWLVEAWQDTDITLRQDNGGEFNKAILFKGVGGVKGNQQRIVKHRGGWLTAIGEGCLKGAVAFSTRM